MSHRSARDWLGFFRDAGIPEEDAKTNGVAFAENRMKGDMLGKWACASENVCT